MLDSKLDNLSDYRSRALKGIWKIIWSNHSGQWNYKSCNFDAWLPADLIPLECPDASSASRKCSPASWPCGHFPSSPSHAPPKPDKDRTEIREQLLVASLWLLLSHFWRFQQIFVSSTSLDNNENNLVGIYEHKILSVSQVRRICICKYVSLYIKMGLPGSSVGKESACNAGDPSLIPGFGRSPEGGHGKPLQLLLPGEAPRRKEPGGLQSMGLQRVRQD